MPSMKIITTEEHAFKDVARFSKQYFKGKRTRAVVRHIIVEVEDCGAGVPEGDGTGEVLRKRAWID